MLRNTAVMPLACAMMLLLCAMGIARHATATPRLQVAIQPIKKRLRASDTLRVRARVLWHGPRAKFTYQWSALRGRLPASVATNAKDLVVSAKDLTPGEEYILELDVGATYTLPPEKNAQNQDAQQDKDVVAAQASVAFSVNAAPSGGDCKATISWDERQRANIVAEATNWHDQDGDALQYRYFIIKGKSRRLAHNWSTAASKKLITRAKPGDTLQVACEVRDSMGDVTQAMSASSKRPSPVPGS